MVDTSVEIRRSKIKWMNSQKTLVENMSVHSTRQRCCDVMLFRKEGSMMRHLANEHL